MIWSLSGYKAFKRCERQWFYHTIMADAKVKKDPDRIEATRLSRLKTVAAWRGMVADQVISDYIIPRLAFKNIPTLTAVLDIAKATFDKQYELATTPNPPQRLEVGLLDFELNGSLPSDVLEQAWKDVEMALTNFLAYEPLIKELLSADRLITQRVLSFKVGEFTVRGVPDLIAFWQNRPPVIYDWKVHFYGTYSYEKQLLIYALALSKGKPHRDFSELLKVYPVDDFRLTEMQLLTHTTGHQRDYTVSTTKLDEIECYIGDGLLAMYLSGAYRSYAESKADDYPTTTNAENCYTCSFSKLCKQL